LDINTVEELRDQVSIIDVVPKEISEFFHLKHKLHDRVEFLEVDASVTFILESLGRDLNE